MHCFFCGLFLLVMLHVGVCYAVVSVPCSLVVTCWERADLLAGVFVVFCHFPECILVHIRIKGEVSAVKLGLSSPVKYFLLTGPRRYFFPGSFVLYLSRVCHALGSVPCCLVVTCWERADLLALVCDVKLCICHFPMWYPVSGVVLDCIDSWSSPLLLFCLRI